MSNKEGDFNKDFKSPETVIGSSVEVEGNFVGQGDVIVEGSVKGSLKTKGNLKVGSGAKIKAEVEAVNAFVAGEIKGNVKARERLELTESAKIFGNVETKVLSVKPGAVLNGKCQMTTEGLAEESMTEFNIEDPTDTKKNNKKRGF